MGWKRGTQWKHREIKVPSSIRLHSSHFYDPESICIDAIFYDYPNNTDTVSQTINTCSLWKIAHLPSLSPGGSFTMHLDWLLNTLHIRVSALQRKVTIPAPLVQLWSLQDSFFKPNLCKALRFSNIA